MPQPADGNRVMQIGAFARRAGVSVRAIRYYEELGLLNPASHSQGGFRLYGNENLRRIRVITFLKDLGLSLFEIRDILLAKKSSGGNQEAVRYLLKAFEDRLRLVDSRLEKLNRMKLELTNAVRILKSCERCDHDVLLDALLCSDCESLQPRDSVPETLAVILQ